MTSRREFLQASVLASTLPLAVKGIVPAHAALADARTSDRLVLHKAIFDDRYAEGHAFANAMRRLGVRSYALENGDVTKLWYEDLDHLWREGPAAIAGMTQFGPMFVLERFARERGMRVLLRVEHQAHASGTLAHVVTGPPSTLSLLDELRDQDVDWPVLMAVLLADCRANRSTPASRTVRLAGAKPELARRGAKAGALHVPESVIHYYAGSRIQEGHDVPWDGPLFSWVIAPRRRPSRSTHEHV
jgi:hypothetical protein